MNLVIRPGGEVRCLYEELIDLGALGRPEIVRASAVEPTADGRWTADLGPMGGPVLGPFGRRSEALAAEVAWLERHWLLDPSRAAEAATAVSRVPLRGRHLTPRYVGRPRHPQNLGVINCGDNHHG